MYNKPQKRILIVEDEANVSNMMRYILEANRFEVTICENGRYALEKHLQYPFPLIITQI